MHLKERNPLIYKIGTDFLDISLKMTIYKTTFHGILIYLNIDLRLALFNQTNVIKDC